jgi:hypothetical protein
MNNHQYLGLCLCHSALTSSTSFTVGYITIHGKETSSFFSWLQQQQKNKFHLVIWNKETA